MSSETSPIKQVFDLAVFGPLGMALAARDALPGWVANARTVATEQFTLAKGVGELVTDYGQQKAKKTLVGLGILPGPPPPPAVPTSSPAPTAAGSVGPAAAADLTPTAAGSVGPAAADLTPAAAGSVGPAAADLTPTAAGSVGPAAADLAAASTNGRSPSGAEMVRDRNDLAIPGYDSLSASQVVSRLDGLAAAELEAVRAYEAGSRGRRTILTKISQLQSGRS